MCKIISIVNQKGGVTKTTSTYNIAACLAAEGYKTLMIDFDSQASLTLFANINVENIEERNMGNVIDKKSPITLNDIILDLAERSSFPIPNLYIAPSHICLAVAESALKEVTARECALRREIDRCAIRDIYDYVVIDCPPSLSDIFVNALVACDEIIIPSTCEYLSYVGIAQLLERVEEIKEYNLNRNISVLGIIATKYKSNTKRQTEVLEALREEYNVLGVIKETENATEGIYDGVPVVLRATSPQGKCVAEEYRNIVKNYIINKK